MEFKERQICFAAGTAPLYRWRQAVTSVIVCCLLMPAMAQATMVWSGCQTITAVSEEPADPQGASILLDMSPGISGCFAQGVAGAINFTAAQGIASADLNGLLATSLSAFTVGKRVMVYYDNSTANCYGQAAKLSPSRNTPTSALECSECAYRSVV